LQTLGLERYSNIGIFLAHSRCRLCGRKERGERGARERENREPVLARTINTAADQELVDRDSKATTIDQ